MSEPTCRTCYAMTLTEDERDRFFSVRPVTSVYYCPEHQAVVDELLDMLAGVTIMASHPTHLPEPMLLNQSVFEDLDLDTWEGEGGHV